jgi:hypothetical protein
MAKRMIDILLRGLEFGKNGHAGATAPAGGPYDSGRNLEYKE